MYCKNCGNQVDDKAVACLKCGANPRNGNSFCANCGAPVNPGQVVCLKCGNKVGGGVSMSGGGGDLAGYDKMTMALICFFLGAIGVHNFMMGETKKGIVKIVGCLLCGLSGILALIDFIKILTDKYEVNPDAMF